MSVRLTPTFALLAVLVSTASAQLFPGVPKSGSVYAGAGLLTKRDRAKIDALSRAFRKDTGAPIVVATLPSLESVSAKSMGIEKYATALFNQWRIGRNTANGGILLLVAKKERKVRIELGKDWKHDYDAKTHAVMQGTIVPAFKRGNFPGGIVKGCQALSKLKDVPPRSAEPAAIAPEDGSRIDWNEGSPNRSLEPPSAGFPSEGLICLALPMAFFIVVMVSLASRRRYRRRGGSLFGSGTSTNGYYDRRNDDDAYLAGVAAGQAMSQPTYDPGPSHDPSPSLDSTPSFDSGGSSDSGSFDSGSSGGGGDTGSW